jgi:spore coat protein A
MTLTRRGLLRLAGGAAGTLPFVSLAGACQGVGSGSTGHHLPSRAELPAPFTVALPIPPVLKPSRTDASTDYYEITQKPATAQILPGHTTQIWGYNGIFPGPTIQSRRGRRVVVRHRNELPVPVVVHLHGGVTPPEHDGYPTDLLLPVGGWTGGHPSHGRHGHHAASGQVSQGAREYAYPLDQPAATLWYHDHRMDFTGPQVYRGLAGFHLVHDDQESALPLPHGERDIPLMICDRSFEEDGSFRYPSVDPTLRDRPGVEERYMEGVLGDVILVNGVAWPLLEVTNTRYRFRILNSSNARRYRLALDPPPREGPAFIQVGSDVGLLPGPLSHDHLDIAQAQRFDVVVDFSSYPIGTEITLANRFGEGPTSQVMRIHVTSRATDDSAVPARLAQFEPLDRAAAQVTRHFTFDQRRDGWAVNGRTFDPDRDDAEPRLGSTEIWHLDTDVHHPVHLHLAHFQVLTRGGRRPGPYDAGWQDTIDLRGEAEIIVRFTGYRGRYVFHCHNLEHEDMAMMANFRVS